LIDFEIALPDAAALDAGSESADAASFVDAAPFGGILESGVEEPAGELATTDGAGGARFVADVLEESQDGLGGASLTHGGMPAESVLDGHGDAVLAG
jgi:hypothetical protein